MCVYAPDQVLGKFLSLLFLKYVLFSNLDV